MRTSKTRVLRFGAFAVLASSLAFACAEEDKKKKSSDDDGGGGTSTTTSTTGVGGSSTTSTSTTTSTTTTSATTSTTTGGGDCVDVINHPAGCGMPDQAACECQGCNTDGTCGNDDDCVCPDCNGNAEICAGAGCGQNGPDGLCDPWSEDCGCADCATHPACN